MPNYCDNSLTLRHTDKSKVDALDAELSKKNPNGYGSNGELLNHLRPNPSGEWDYNWSVENWGTKWDASIIDWERRDDNEIWVSFESAWSPPTTIYDYLVEQGWEVEAYYYEPGMGYAGEYTTEGGDDYYEYDLSDPESIEELPESVIEFGDLRTRSEEHIIYLMEEQWGDSERTDWYPVDVKPVRDGYYEIQCKNGQYSSEPNGTYVQFAKFKDGEWDFWNLSGIIGWRGLAEDPNEAEVD